MDTNLYSYSATDPIDNFDPNGLETKFFFTRGIFGIGNHIGLYIDHTGSRMIYDPGGSYATPHDNAREFSADVGRWIQRDPILFAGKDTNLFSYVWSDPINAIDSAELWGFAGIGGTAVEFGAGIYGAAYTHSRGRGFYYGPNGWTSGAFTSIGSFSNTRNNGQKSDPVCNPDQKNGAFGAYAGFGGGGFISNADSVDDLLGAATVYNLNLPVAALQVSVGDNGIWSFSITVGPGMVFSASQYRAMTTPR